MRTSRRTTSASDAAGHASRSRPPPRRTRAIPSAAGDNARRRQTRPFSRHPNRLKVPLRRGCCVGIRSAAHVDATWASGVPLSSLSRGTSMAERLNDRIAGRARAAAEGRSNAKEHDETGRAHARPQTGAHTSAKARKPAKASKTAGKSAAAAAKPTFTKKTIALVYDFDGTLSPRPMQEYAVPAEDRRRRRRSSGRNRTVSRAAQGADPPDHLHAPDVQEGEGRAASGSTARISSRRAATSSCSPASRPGSTTSRTTSSCARKATASRCATISSRRA